LELGCENATVGKNGKTYFLIPIEYIKNIKIYSNTK